MSTDSTVYMFIHGMADHDGLARVSGPQISNRLGIPAGTVANALKRLQNQGRINLVFSGRNDSTTVWAVTELVLASIGD